MRKTIPFSPPDITQKEIDAVCDTLKSGWITTGPKTKLFESKIASYSGAKRAICLSSATAGLELILRMFDIGEGDEVITTPFTYCATANVIIHTGATPVFVDIGKDSFNIDYSAIERKITEKTKAIITVDYGGFPCDYEEIKTVLKSEGKFTPKKNTLQEKIERPLLIDDAAHSLGSSYKGLKIGSKDIADFTVFSFHAVKNLTTAEGGAVVFDDINDLSSEEIYRNMSLLSLHGQTKDALAKTVAGSWRYDIEIAGFKYNMTDIQASIGLAQLERFDDEILSKRERLFQIYINEFKNEADFIIPNFFDENKRNNFHLFPLRIKNFNESQRDLLIKKMAEKKIALNVHFIPLPMLSLYKNLGYDIKDFPNAFDTYQNLVTLPIYSKLSEEDALYVARELKKSYLEF